MRLHIMSHWRTGYLQKRAEIMTYQHGILVLNIDSQKPGRMPLSIRQFELTPGIAYLRLTKAY